MKLDLIIILIIIYTFLSACTKKCISPIDASNTYDRYIISSDTDNMWKMQSREIKEIYDSFLFKSTESRLVLKLRAILQEQSCLESRKINGEVLFKLIHNKILSENVIREVAFEKYMNFNKDTCNIFIKNNDSLERVGGFIFERNKWKVSKPKDNSDILNMIRFIVLDYNLQKDDVKDIYFCR